MAQEEEEEVLMEVEAVESVYGDDCIILTRFPPHLHLHIKPRTADVHSQQFVEATIELRAGPQYPSDPPYIGIIGSKGLDENRQKHLLTGLHDKVRELASCLMLVALCEEAVEILTSINHPEGDCPLCLYPLVPEDSSTESQPFMKLMSCFHCFHCDCIVRWLKWIQEQNEANSSTVNGKYDRVSDFQKMMSNKTGNCPVCRKVFLEKDIEHVLKLVDSHDVNADVYEKELVEKVLQCDLETSRRQKFEAISELQHQNNGLIEPPKNNVLFSRISIQDLLSEVAEVSNDQASETDLNNQIVRDEQLESTSSSSSSSNRRKHHQRSHSETSRGPTTRASGGPRRYYGPRKQGRNYSRKQSNPSYREE